MRPTRTGNYFLDALTPATAQRLLSACRSVDLPLQAPLYRAEDDPQFVWFLTGGIASFTFTSVRGTTIELATVGKEGVVGGFAVLGSQRPTGACGMQLAGSGYRMPLALFQAEFRDCVEVRDRLLQLVLQQMDMAYQIVACNRLHKAQARFARWLLMVRERVESDVLPMTQEFLADMLGTRRTTVVEVAGELQRRGAIEYRRGVIRIRDRRLLEEQTCECYPLLKDRYERLYSTPPRPAAGA